ncbi:MAG: sigma-70 family RNA polymerase sigma factor [Anaerolineae bacterium]|nr:sigma-70 family RNA polymerase sigma factor [Anaerolineae bacterium]
MNAPHPSVQELAVQCQAETADTRMQENPNSVSACYELFRRAIVERCQDAWEAIYHQYQGLVRHWSHIEHQDSQDVVQSAFEKFARAVDASRFSRFANIATLLAYLKKCTRSVEIDMMRKQGRESLIIDAFSSDRDGASNTSEARVLENMVIQQLVDHVRGRLQDEDEKLVVYLSFELDFRPAEIAKRYPDRFATARQVSRIKERIILRVSQDPFLRNLGQ